MHKGIALEFYRKFSIYAFRFLFRASDRLIFPSSAANLIRGALGMELQKIETEQNFFRPQNIAGPSGFADPPRPFVLRAHELNSCTIETGSTFSFDIHFFEQGVGALQPFTGALVSLQQTGIGQHRSRIQLESIASLDEASQEQTIIWAAAQWLNTEFNPISMTLGLKPLQPETVMRTAVHFLTPTELKQDGEVNSDFSFAVLFARLQQRISALSLFYGENLGGLDSSELTRKSHAVCTVENALSRQTVERRSSRTRQTHPLGGWTGTMIYEGPLTAFLPWLRVAYWTGIGRQTVWGKGIITLMEQPERLLSDNFDQREP